MRHKKTKQSNINLWYDETQKNKTKQIKKIYVVLASSLIGN